MTGTAGPGPFNTRATLDNIAHFAWAYGDDNPLYHDEHHAATSRWGGVIAPPLIWRTAEPFHLPTVRDDGRGGLEWRRVDERWQFVRPVPVGAQLSVEYRLTDDEHGPVASYVGRSSGERLAEWTRSVAADWEPCAAPPVTALDRAESTALADAVAAEGRRGNAALLAGDVVVGEHLPERRRGPLTVTDTIVLLAGAGPAAGSPAPLRPDRARLPEPLPWRRHGELAMCDDGRLRALWLLHHVTDWMGDAASVESFEFAVSRPAWEGEVHTVATTVEAVGTDGRIVLHGRAIDPAGNVTADSRTSIATHETLTRGHR
jgi:hypothetical protein